MKFKRTANPVVSPISLKEGKDHLRVTGSDEDALILSLIKVATELAEQRLNRGFITQTWKYYLDTFPFEDFIELARAPLQSVTSVKYNDEDGNEQTFASSNYITDTISEPGMIRLKEDASWPDDRDILNDVTIEYKIGYGDNMEDVPDRFKHLIKLIISDLYENREDMVKAKMTASKRFVSLDKVMYV